MTARTLWHSASAAAANLTAVGELVAAVLPALPGSGPSSAADVTAGWLTEQLARTTPGAVAQRISPMDGTTGTTDRRRLAVEWNESGRAAGLPDHLFVKSTPLSAKNRTMVAALGVLIATILFLIVELSHPYIGEIATSPEPLREVIHVLSPSPA